MCACGPYIVLLGRNAGKEGVSSTITIVHGYRSKATDRLQLSVVLSEDVPKSLAGLEPSTCTLAGDADHVLFGFTDGTLAVKPTAGRDSKTYSWTQVFPLGLSVGYLESITNSRTVMVAHVSEDPRPSSTGKPTIVSLTVKPNGQLQEVVKDSIQVSACALAHSQQTTLILSNSSQVIFFFHATSGNIRAIPIESPAQKITSFGRYLLLESCTGSTVKKFKAYFLVGKCIVEAFNAVVSTDSDDCIAVSGSNASTGIVEVGSVAKTFTPLLYVSAKGSLGSLDPRKGLLNRLVDANAFVEALEVCVGNEQAEAAVIVRYAEHLAYGNGKHSRVEKHSRDRVESCGSVSSRTPVQSMFDLFSEHAMNSHIQTSIAIHFILLSGRSDIAVSMERFGLVVQFLCKRWSLLDATGYVAAIACSATYYKMKVSISFLGDDTYIPTPLTLLRCVADDAILHVYQRLDALLLEEISSTDDPESLFTEYTTRSVLTASSEEQVEAHRRPVELCGKILDILVKRGLVPIYSKVINMESMRDVLRAGALSKQCQLAALLHRRSEPGTVGKDSTHAINLPKKSQMSLNCLQFARRVEVCSGRVLSADCLESIQSEGHFGDIKRELLNLLSLSEAEALKTDEALLSKDKDIENLNIRSVLSKQEPLVFKGYEECGVCRKAVKAPFYVFSCQHVYHASCLRSAVDPSDSTAVSCSMCAERSQAKLTSLEAETLSMTDPFVRGSIAVIRDDYFTKVVQ